MTKNQVIGVGDASIDNLVRSHAYVIETMDKKYNIQGAAPVYADPEDITSNRAKGLIVLAMVTLLDAIAQKYQISLAKVNIYCDNEEAILHKSLEDVSYSKLTKRNIDIKLEIQHLISPSPLQFAFQSVPGHQDHQYDFEHESASQLVQHNIDMDQKTKHFITHHPQHMQPSAYPLQLPEQKVTLERADSLIARDLPKQIHLHQYGPNMEQ